MLGVYRGSRTASTMIDLNTCIHARRNGSIAMVTSARFLVREEVKQILPQRVT